MASRPGRRVSIPSGRGFWAGLLKEMEDEKPGEVSIPSGRGFWAGLRVVVDAAENKVCLNPLWSGLLGRHGRPA